MVKNKLKRLSETNFSSMSDEADPSGAPYVCYSIGLTSNYLTSVNNLSRTNALAYFDAFLVTEKNKDI
jgi:hypothetical protein